jgi:Ca2+-binding RTX toxin-like protein
MRESLNPTDRDYVEDGVDTLLGGHGNDTLNGNAGDVMSGGSSIDEFIVHLPETQNAETWPDAAIITDFDPATETVEVIVNFREDASTVQGTDPDTGDAALFVDGTMVVVFQGLTPAQMGWS